MSTEADKQYLLDLILFCGIGDGYITPLDSNRNSYLTICHSLDQLDYAMWKVALLEKAGLKFGKPYFRKDKKEVRIRSARTPLCTVARKRLYRGRTKVITRRLLRRLTPLGMAIWFCDDGSYTKVKPRWRKDLYEVNERPTYKISAFKLSTQSFSLKENKDICVMLERNFDLKWKIYTYKNLPYLQLSGIEQLESLKNLLSDYIPLSMRYKIDHPTSFTKI